MLTKIILEKRSKTTKEFPVRIYFWFKKRPVYIPTGISVSESNFEDGEIINLPEAKKMNAIIKLKKLDIDTKLLDLEFHRRVKYFDASTIKQYLEGKCTEEDDISFKKYYDSYITRLSKNKGTIGTFFDMIKKLSVYTDVEKLSFENMNKAWLQNFDNWMENSGLSDNTRGIYLRNIRTLFNDAIDNNVISLDKYPFRRFKIKTKDTEPKPMELHEFKAFVNAECTPAVERYKKLFLLSFYLRGLNMKDILFLPPNAITKGYIVLSRTKTNVPLKIKIYPEAMEIINEYKGINYLLNPMDTRSNYRDFERTLNKQIKSIGQPKVERKKRGEKQKIESIKPKGPFDKISIYWARYTFSTFAADLDIPDKYIDLMIGHKRTGMIDKYVKRRQEKLDEYHRQVLDYAK
ncbi:MAG: site-specific integrase [Bacteroidota bacterium]|nr:site-specific integrase [Bacteroidota bacterium]